MSTCKSSLNVANQYHKHLFIVSSSVLDNGTMKGDAIPPLVLLTYKLHVNLCPVIQCSIGLCFAPSSQNPYEILVAVNLL
ncbi:hypothetical protein EUGRSUZ_F02412 [Eucalyptus grandis]|uniref:Uncharacterized protein n=2 Tax=Eucalyptus grandis TaxID=71139 RepID=A0ACC3KHK3_EUCGR|nr:hypothetical protein EUGRSUZ_F02412 [Eucalyptus grandis]